MKGNRDADDVRMKKKYWTPKRRSTQDWSHLVTFTCNVCNLGKLSITEFLQDEQET